MYRKKGAYSYRKSSSSKRRKPYVRASYTSGPFPKDRNGTVGPYLPASIKSRFVGNVFQFAQTCSEALINLDSLAVPPGLVKAESVDSPGNNVTWLYNNPITSYADIVPGTIMFPISPMFRISDLQQFGTIAALFDTIRLDYVEVTVCNAVSNSFASTSTPDKAGQIPTMVIVYDTDNYTVLGSGADAGQYASAKTVVLNQGISHSFRCKPHLATYAYRSSGVASPGYKTSPATWFNSVYGNVEHYAYKLWFSNCAAEALQQFAIRLSVKLFISAKNTN